MTKFQLLPSDIRGPREEEESFSSLQLGYKASGRGLRHDPSLIWQEGTEKRVWSYQILSHGRYSTRNERDREMWEKRALSHQIKSPKMEKWKRKFFKFFLSLCTLCLTWSCAIWHTTSTYDQIMIMGQAGESQE